MSAAHVLPLALADSHEPQVEITHEAFVHAVRAIVVRRVAAASRKRLLGAKLVYGRGPDGVRGLCYFDAWKNGSAHDFLEILGDQRGEPRAARRDHDP